MLADIQCSYIKQLKHPVTVEVGTRVSKIGRSSMVIEAAVFEEGVDVPAAHSKGVVVWFDYQQQKTVPVPEWLRVVIRAMEPLPPEE